MANATLEYVEVWHNCQRRHPALGTDGDGEFAFDFDVPTDEEADIVVTIQCGDKVPSDAVTNVNAEGEGIANAGSNAGLLAVGAVGAIALGDGALFVSSGL